MTFYSKLSFNFLRDAQPVAGLASISYMMLVNPGVPAKTVPEFIAYAKANPGKINFASGGVGSSNQLAGELFKVMTEHESRARALSRQCRGLYRPDRRANPADLRRRRLGPPARAVRRAARARRHRADAACDAARRSGDRRGRSRLRGERLVRLRGAERHAGATSIAKLNAAINAGLTDPEREGALRAARGDAARVHAEAIRRVPRFGSPSAGARP